MVVFFLMPGRLGSAKETQFFVEVFQPAIKSRLELIITKPVWLLTDIQRQVKQSPALCFTVCISPQNWNQDVPVNKDMSC